MDRTRLTLARPPSSATSCAPMMFVCLPEVQANPLKHAKFG